MEQKRKTIEWHPAFTASLQIEFEDEADKIIFESEHLLSKKPMQIDELVIKVHDNEKIQKNIGRIFRKHNIVEYKSPEDYLTINDFYKVYGYCCFISRILNMYVRFHRKNWLLHLYVTIIREIWYSIWKKLESCK